ncbi:MAG: GNAT family N-acetyltransferase [Nitriliruptoraceae bacterium]
MIELRTHDTVPTGGAVTEWQLLLDEDPHATVFHSPRYLRLWHETLGQRYPIRIHTVHSNGRIIGVVPDANDRSGSPTGPVELRRFMGGTEVTDYLGPISRVEDRADVATAYIRNLAEDVDWDEFIAGGLMSASGWGDAFRRAAEEHGLQTTHEEIEHVCPALDIHQGFDAYRNSLPGRVRGEFARKARKLAREVGPLELIEVAPDDIGDSLDLFFEQAVTSVPNKASFFQRDDMREWFSALAGEFAGDRIFRLHRLEADGLPAAMTVSLVGEGQWGLYNSAFDVELASFAPGMVIIWMLIEQACMDQLAVFDLLRGDEPYKYQFGAVDRPLERIVFARA